MGFGCICSENRKCKYATPKELQEIIETLIKTKKYLEKDLYGHSLNNENKEINNKKKKSINEYLKIINQLIIDVEKLEKQVNELNNQDNNNNSNTINNNNNDNDLNILINFQTASGSYKIFVKKETKLLDAFEKALFNDKIKGKICSINMDNKTQLNNTCYKTTLYNVKDNYKKMKFLLGGDDVSENFRKNQPVSSLNENLDSHIIILVMLPVSTKNILKTYYENN